MSSRLAKTVSVQQAAELLGISRNHAVRCVQRGEIPAIRIGRRLLIPTSFLERLLEPTLQGDRSREVARTTARRR
jgi:excisionase family DNA binding protein